jgi:hypothetical protein
MLEDRRGYYITSVQVIVPIKANLFYAAFSGFRDRVSASDVINGCAAIVPIVENIPRARLKTLSEPKG